MKEERKGKGQGREREERKREGERERNTRRSPSWVLATRTAMPPALNTLSAFDENTHTPLSTSTT